MQKSVGNCTQKYRVNSFSFIREKKSGNVVSLKPERYKSNYLNLQNDMSTQKNKVRVVITDDHQIFIEGIRSLIKDSDKVILVGEASNGEELLELLKTREADVVLMDVHMPKVNGIEATSKSKYCIQISRFLVLPW